MIKSYCIVPGCNNIAETGYRCNQHRQPKTRTYKPRPGYDHAWQVFSKAFLKDNPICFVCKEPATVTGHWEMSGTEMLKTWGKFLLDRRMYKPLCTRCNQLHYRRIEKDRQG